MYIQDEDWNPAGFICLLFIQKYSFMQCKTLEIDIVGVSKSALKKVRRVAKI